MAKTIHLKKEKMFQFGAYYTPARYVKIVWDFIKPYLDNHTVILDPACGYGSFLEPDFACRKIGNDIDKYAVSVARENIPGTTFFTVNALVNYRREVFGIRENERLIIIGNPPYNDTTSQVKKNRKKPDYEIQENIRSRDIGISFLRMMSYLQPEYICVLHPLSYLVKETNFHALKEFRQGYRLMDGIIFSSKEFGYTSKVSAFPILIGFYKKHDGGMSFDYIKNFLFRTVEGDSFKITDFDYIGRYISKYPKKSGQKDCELYFYTLRDINALKRNKTFLEKPNRHALCVDLEKLDFYVYVDVFKDFANSIPYYLGNLDIIIDVPLFRKKKKYFLNYAIHKKPFLSKYYPDFRKVKNYRKHVTGYFDTIFTMKRSP